MEVEDGGDNMQKNDKMRVDMLEKDARNCMVSEANDAVNLSDHKSINVK